MKKTITILGFTAIILKMSAQISTADFESFTLSPNSAYSNTASVPFQTVNASFQHKWDNTFNFWAKGFSYTNKYDSSTAGSANMYGVRAYKGRNSSAIYVVGQDSGKIKTLSSQIRINGFYITNTTYAYKSMKKGDSFAKKFGGTSGNDPDFFKVVIRGYNGGVLKADTAEFYLADFRFSNNTQDYIVDSWQFVNTSNIGIVDSIQFILRSSDVGGFGMNTPAFFAIDDFTTEVISPVGLNEFGKTSDVLVYPNPFGNLLNINCDNIINEIYIQLTDLSGKTIYEVKTTSDKTVLELSELETGMYFLIVDTEKGRTIKKIFKD